MTSFLSWVYNQAAKVYDWFGNSYNTLRNAAANAWNWAVTQANNAYNNAISYAYDLFKSIGNAASLTASWVLSQISNAVDSVSEDIAGLFDWVSYQISLVNSAASRLIYDLLNGVYASIDNIQAGIIGLVDRSIQYVYDWVTSGFGWILDIRDRLLSLLSVFDPSNISLLLNFLSTWLNTIVEFFHDPLGFILGVIQPKIISFLCYVIAWAMGTTLYDLPTSPTWKDR